MDLLSHDDRSTLTFDDWNSLTNIRNAYEEYCIQPYLDSHQSIPPIPPKQPYRARLKLQRLVDLKYKHTIIIASYIKRILQCDAFPTSLEYGYPYLKDSFQCLITLNSCDLMKSKVLENVPWEHDRLALEAVLTGEVIERLGEILNTYQSLLPHDPIIMKLFVIILALSSRVLPLVRKAEYNAMDFKPLPRNFLASQNFYITLLWKYVVHRLGYNDAVLFSVRFIQTFLRRQRIEADIVDIVQSREDHGQLIHMMQMSMKI